MIEMRYSARELSSEAKSKGIVSFANEEQPQYDYDDDDDYIMMILHPGMACVDEKENMEGSEEWPLHHFFLQNPWLRFATS